MYTPIFPPQIGGPSTQCFNLCRALVGTGIEPIVVTWGSSFDRREEHGFIVRYFRSSYTNTPIDKVIRWALFPFYIAYVFIKERIDVLHCHSVSVLSFIAAVIARTFGKPRMLKFAGDWVWETLSTDGLKAKDFDDIYKTSFAARALVRFEKWGLRLFDVIWVVSEFRVQNIKTLLGKTSNVVHIPNCLLLTGGGARDWNQADPPIVVSANRFIPHKRIPLIVELFSKLDIPGSKLVLIGGGNGEIQKEVEATVEKYGLTERVRLTGVLKTEDVYSEFSKASFYLSMSLEEGFPNVFIEAMHYGLPVITTDAGGSGELVLDKKTGFVIDPYDNDKFVSKMRLLGSDTLVRNEMSKNAYEWSKEFNLEHKVDEFVSLYRKLIDG